MRVTALAVLFSTAAVYEGVHVSAIANTEVWLHLRTGLWILENHSFPRNGLFSQYPDLPWMDSSWAFDVRLAVAYRIFSLMAIPLSLMVMKVALAVIAFLLARAGQAKFWAAVVLSGGAQFVLTELQPVPLTVSILFFGIELVILFHSRASGRVKILYWLVPLFIVWANMHLQFVTGLIVLGLFCLAIWVEEVLRRSRTDWVDAAIQPLPLSKAGAVAGLSLLGTFLTPYSYHLLPIAYRSLYSDIAFQYFAEMRAMSFRRPQDFALMLLVMVAFLALGRKRSVSVFELLLIGGTLVAFRIQRDAWMAVLPAIAIAAGVFRRKEDEPDVAYARSFRWEWASVAIIVAVILAIAAIRMPRRDALMSRISAMFPVKACAYIAQNHLPAPMFNAYSWGGFLTWYLPDYPVAIDSRIDLYGDEILSRYFTVTSGGDRLDADPTLAAARTLLLERQSGMAKALTSLPALNAQYRLVYSDDQAAVFVRQ